MRWPASPRWCRATSLGHRKALVLLGYALTPLVQVFIALAVGWPLLLLGQLLS
ncbi:MAG: hypothetical protein KKE51_04525 [Gammaproteobacteria bacterium]|jgi:hypothetical protein|nr:hypothetical protein [Gammaproteobacteria bacterium]MBU2435488.1 hypothetical protein [Gammaproteobacteria bacterium]